MDFFTWLLNIRIKHFSIWNEMGTPDKHLIEIIIDLKCVGLLEYKIGRRGGGWWWRRSWLRIILCLLRCVIFDSGGADWTSTWHDTTIWLWIHIFYMKINRFCGGPIFLQAFSMCLRNNTLLFVCVRFVHESNVQINNSKSNISYIQIFYCLVSHFCLYLKFAYSWNCRAWYRMAYLSLIQSRI